jgi:predicted ribosome quality control (RQC) complex YloA/Tae2 family protein
VAPIDIVIEEEDQSFVTYEQLLESHRKQQKGLEDINDVVIDLQLDKVGKRNNRRRNKQRSRREPSINSNVA